MSNKLIIVESPTKVHTIKKFLGSGYSVVASQGHVRDLPKSTIGVDIDHHFEPHYILIRGKGEIISALKKEIKKADKIYLATDPDREGEAISWHLMQAFDMTGKEVYRITFNEITKEAVKQALKNPRKIDEKLVDAQQARRVMDRVVGYKLSPILWKKIKGKLSAGRVQSAVLNVICEKEDEIRAFIPEEYWTLEGVFGQKTKIKAEYYGESGKKKEVKDEKEAEKIVRDCEDKEAKISEVKTGKRMKNPPYPFTTSTLQQEAANVLNFTTGKTMSAAQQLYEGVSVPGRGTIGLITYLRTDSTRISTEADANCKKYIEEVFGKESVGAGQVKNRANAQDAHEAIRPTDVTLTPDLLKNVLPRELYRLYDLIWKRFVASRMKAAVYDTAVASLEIGTHTFRSSMSRLSFKGFLAVYQSDEEKTNGSVAIMKLLPGESIFCEQVTKEQHFTQPPARFTEASLVRFMEEEGLGRPSTYAPTISHMLAKHYIAKESKAIVTTELGEVVNDLMKKSFPEIVDKSFTAHMETELDEVAEGRKEWKSVMEEFYPDFEKNLKKAETELEKVKVEDEVSTVVCDKCGRFMVVKYGRNGKFLACPGFPECRNVKPLLEKIDALCPTCGKEMVLRRTKKGRRFYACIDSEGCGFTSWNKPEKK